MDLYDEYRELIESAFSGDLDEGEQEESEQLLVRGGLLLAVDVAESLHDIADTLAERDG